MKRKEFIRQLGLIAGGVTVGLDKVTAATAYAYNPVQVNMQATKGKIMVLVQLAGGNDGLNTVIPFQDDIYYKNRPDIAIKKSDALSLNGEIGFNPSMAALKKLYDNNKVSVIQSVGYPNHSRSHFRSTDIWNTASDANVTLQEGWAGRYLNTIFPEYPVKLPEQPMAIQLGSVESLLLQTDLGRLGTVFEDPNTFFTLVNGSTSDNDAPPATLAGNELKFLKQVAVQSIQYSAVIKAASDKGTNQMTYPNTGLGRQLSIVAKMISGGSETPVFLTTIGGFDTHANQLGQHFNLWKTVSDAIATFQTDLEKQGLADKVTVLTFSEFGRRVNQNGTLGTDHGSTAPMFVVGNSVRGGIIGANPNLSDLDGNGDYKLKIDYRQIYATVMRDHLGVESSSANSILKKDFEWLPIYRKSAERTSPESVFDLVQNYPNPVEGLTKIRYVLNKQQPVRLTLHDMTGMELMVLKDEIQDPGTYTQTVDMSTMPSGLYLYSLMGEGGQRKSLRMVVSRG
jgi:uncharacterized protein (DUF1501 family)